MKDHFKCIAASFLFLSLSLVSSAQSKTSGPDLKPFLSHESEIQPALELDQTYRPSESLQFREENLESGESILLVEDWMLLKFPSEESVNRELLRVDDEISLKLEEWMLCTNSWCLEQ